MLSHSGVPSCAANQLQSCVSKWLRNTKLRLQSLCCTVLRGHIYCIAVCTVCVSNMMATLLPPERTWNLVSTREGLRLAWGY